MAWQIPQQAICHFPQILEATDFEKYTFISDIRGSMVPLNRNKCVKSIKWLLVAQELLHLRQSPLDAIESCGDGTLKLCTKLVYKCYLLGGRHRYI